MPLRLMLKDGKRANILINLLWTKVCESELGNLLTSPLLEEEDEITVFKSQRFNLMFELDHLRMIEHMCCHKKI